MRSRKSSKYKEKVVDLAGPSVSVKVEPPNPGQHEFLAIIHPPHDVRSITPLSGTYLQIPTRQSSRSSWNSSSGFQDVEDSVPPDKSYYGTVKDISPAFSLGKFYPFPELSHSPYHSTEVPVGGVDLEPLRYLPIEPSRRNSELFQFCKCFYNTK